MYSTEPPLLKPEDGERRCPLKKYIALLLTVFLLLSVSVSCGHEEPTETVVNTTIGGQEMTVTFNPGTYSEGRIESATGAYSFAYNRSGDLEITYPDGSSCTYRKTQNAASLGASPDFDPGSKGYPDGITMAWGIEHAIDQARPSTENRGNVLLGILLLAVGAWFAFAPRSAWYLGHGWRFKNAEPSDAVLVLYGLGGGVLLFIGAICLLAAIF